MKQKLLGLVVLVLIAAGVWRFQREEKTILVQTPTAWTEDHRADCAVVLTGSRGRVREGFDLLAQRRVRKLIISGVYPLATLREIFPRLPYYGTVNPNDVILEKRSGTTYGNAKQSLPLVEALHCRDVVLITSRLHMYRAMRIFEGVFPPDFPIYPRAIVSGSYHPAWSDVSMEALKSLFYSLWAY